VQADSLGSSRSHPVIRIGGLRHPRQSLIPRVVLQGILRESQRLALRVRRRRVAGPRCRIVQREQTVGFDVSFVNTSDKIADLVFIRVGGTDFAKTGTFPPNAVVAWRIAAKSGSECSVRAVRFADGTECEVRKRSPRSGSRL
jgi:hypothetical protein